jgi:hypothetical protein
VVSSPLLLLLLNSVLLLWRRCATSSCRT